MRARIGRVLVMALTVPFFLSSCSTNSAQRVIDEVNAYPLVSTLNGTVPPGEPTLVHTSQEILNVMRDGQQVRVYRDVREAGTRAPIHIHPFGGWTCVVSGQAVLYLEGAEPQETGPGECVHMPAMTSSRAETSSPPATT